MTDNLPGYAHRPLAFIMRHIRAALTAHLVILGTVAAAVGCSVGTQYGLKNLVDALGGGRDHIQAVWIAFALLAALIAGDNLLWRVAGWVSAYAFVNLTGTLRADLFRHLSRQSVGYFADRLPGTLTARVTATANAIFIIESMFSWNVLPPVIATFCAIALFATVSWTMTAILCVIALVMLVLLFHVAAAGRPLHHRFAATAAGVDGEMTDIISNLPLVRAFSGFKREYERFDAAVGNEMTARRTSLLYLERLRITHAAATAMLTAGLLWWSISLWQRGAASAGDVVLVCSLGFTVLHATRDLAVALVDVTQHMARLTEALATLLVPHEIASRPNAHRLRVTGGSITFDHVCFSYGDGKMVFEDLDFRVKPGERVGLVGRSGCGKSTALQLLQRNYELLGGRILIDGQDIATVTLDSLSDAMSVVPQEAFMFHRSILENIRYGRPDASDKDVLTAAEAARCNEFIDLLPEGYATIVGDRGVKLSGGQRQRIAIARALLKAAPILLLDEATSALDIESEAVVRDALDRLMQGKTVIAVAHRIATLRNFDRIIVMDEGRVIQDGSPDHLKNSSGMFRDLIAREITHLGKRTG